MPNDASVGSTLGSSLSLFLMGGFELRGSDRVKLPTDAERLVAFLAVHVRPLPREYVAGTLWGECSQQRAYANMRSALWRVRKQAKEAIEADRHAISISPAVSVDVRHVVTAARELNAPDYHARVGAEEFDPALFSQQLLPGWYEDWVNEQREQLRQTSLHALEALVKLAIDRNAFDAAIHAALLAVAQEPLRESAHRLLMEAHLREGNRSEAIRQFQRYRTLLWEELRMPPSQRMRTLITHLDNGA